jgi:hypothetical protein
VEAEREREREREELALGAVWSSAAVWHQCGSGPAAARTGGALPRDSGGRRRRRDVDGVADWWAGTRRGPGHQRLGAARGSAMRRSARR